MRRLLISLVLLAGCAPTTAFVDGKTVPRLDMDFVGQPFVVRVSAAHPRPGSPSGGLRDFGGRISGNICGLDITYDVQHEGDQTHLTGFVDEKQTDSRLDVKDVNGVSRQITARSTPNRAPGSPRPAQERDPRHHRAAHVRSRS